MSAENQGVMHAAFRTADLGRDPAGRPRRRPGGHPAHPARSAILDAAR